MKFFTLVFWLFGVVTFCHGKNVYIPDSVFKTYLLNQGYINTNNDDEIQEEEASSLIDLWVLNLDITDLTGIEAFSSLEQLYCVGNKLVSLDLSSNTQLKYLNCSSNLLTDLNISSNTLLLNFNCSENKLSQLDLSNNTSLEYLTCSYNRLAELDLSSNTQLKSMECEWNQLTTLDVSNSPSLERLQCHDNFLGFLSVSNNPKLCSLACYGNLISTLDVSSATDLTYFDCAGNNLASLDLSTNKALDILVCGVNQLTELDLSNNTKLDWLICAANKLEHLNIRNGNNEAITIFSADYNPDLFCIEVDDTAYSKENWVSIDPQAKFSISCSGVITAKPNTKNPVNLHAKPVPASDNVHLTLKEPFKNSEVFIFDMLGNEIGQVPFEISFSEVLLDVSSLNPGNYLVHVRGPDFLGTSRIVIQ